MNREIKVSVIIPIYNVENYLEECILSAANQTLRDIEILCINDGSKDGSAEIADRYAQWDSRIVVLNKKNGGLSSARNFGLKAAKGEYVYFLDSDDYIEITTLETLYWEMKSNHLDTLFFDGEVFFERRELKKTNKSYIGYYHREELYNKVMDGQQLFTRLVRKKEYRSSACLQMNRREFLLENDLYFLEGILHEDELFTMRASLYAKRVKLISVPFYQRRIRDDSIMTGKSAMKSAYGYYTCIARALPEIGRLVTDPVYQKIYRNRLSVLRMNAAIQMEQVIREGTEEAEEELYFKDRFEEKLLFDLMVREEAVKRLSSRRVSTELRDLKKSSTWKAGEKVTALSRKVQTYLSSRKPMKEEPEAVKVSVIMPVYNGEKYLQACVESLLSQTLREIEIICVDDQSADSSIQILEGLRSRDARVHILNQPHLGAGPARNLGMQHAKGEYLLFLDCDDYFDPDLCRITYEKAVEKQAEVILFGAQRKDMQTNAVETMGWVLRAKELPKNKVFSGMSISGRIFQVTSNCPWSKLFKRTYVEQLGLQYQNLQNCNDAYFIRMAIAMAERICVVDEILVTYRYNMSGSTQGKKSKAPLEFYKAFCAVKDSLLEKDLFYAYEKSFLNWTLTECIFNYETVRSEEDKKKILDKMKEEGFERLGISGCGAEDIYNAALYEKYLSLIGDESHA